MTSAFREHSHFDPESPSASVHGARGDSSAGVINSAAAGNDDASSTDHVGEKAPPAVVLTKRQKVKRHCGLFWIWYLIGSIIFLAILLPILFKVILPAIVQAIVNKQTMPIISGGFVSLEPDRIQVSLKTMLDTPLPAVLDPTTLQIYNKNATEFSPFIDLAFDEQHIHKNTEVIIRNQTVTINNQTELVAWLNQIFDLEKVPLSTRSDLVVRLGSLQSNAHLEHTVDLKALNKFTGFGIQELNVMLPPVDGNNIKGTLNLPNWGTLDLNFGNISFNLLSGDTRIGLITVYNTILPPGNNTLQFDGNVFLNEVVDNLGDILASQGDALGRGMIDLNTTGNATMFNGQHIPYIEAVLNHKKLTSSMPVTKLLSDVLGGLLGATGSKASLLDAVKDIAGNHTFIDDVMGRWNASQNARSGSRGAASPKMKRTLPRGAMAWSMLKMGMKIDKLKM